MQDSKVDYRTDPARYRHWKLSFDGRVARLAMDVAEDAGIREATSSSSIPMISASTSSSTTPCNASVSSTPRSAR